MLALVAALMVVTFTACQPPLTPPLPTAMLLPPSDPSAQCVAGVFFTGAAAVAAVPTAGLTAWIAWGGVAFGGLTTTQDCIDSSNSTLQDFAIQLSCDGGVTTFWRTFNRYIDYFDYMLWTSCFSQGVGGGGGGGGGGGW